MEKLKRQAGESLVELLLSMLIISLGMMMLAGAITTTARLNNTAREMSMGKEVNPEPVLKTELLGITLNNSPLENMRVYAIPSENDMELYFYE